MSGFPKTKLDDFKQENLADFQKKSLNIKNKTMNELRAMLYMQGIEYEDDATRQELVNLLIKQ